MFIVNQFGRIVGLPENMEESGFKQAKEVLSISDSLMDNGNYMIPSGSQGGVLISKSGRNLRNEILAKFPKVMRDSEYIEQFINAKKAKLTEVENGQKIPRNAKTTKVSGTRQKNR